MGELLDKAFSPTHRTVTETVRVKLASVQTSDFLGGHYCPRGFGVGVTLKAQVLRAGACSIRCSHVAFSKVCPVTERIGEK